MYMYVCVCVYNLCLQVALLLISCQLVVMTSSGFILTCVLPVRLNQVEAAGFTPDTLNVFISRNSFFT